VILESLYTQINWREQKQRQNTRVKLSAENKQTQKTQHTKHSGKQA